MNIHFGFDDISYPGASSYVSRAGMTYGEGKNTTQVAAELEERYKIVETFVQMEEDFIVSLVEDKMLEDLEEIVTMSEITKKRAISDENTDKLVEKFKRYISHRKFDGVIPGVPTLASLRGVSHLRKHPYARRESRPSFRDTGNYVNSFRVWTED